MKKKTETEYFAFETNTSPENLLRSLPSVFDDYWRENRLDLRLNVMEDGKRFRIGLGRAGHSSGDWYCAHIEKVDGKTRISGKIILDPDENDLPKPVEKMPFRDWLWVAPLASLIVILGAIPYAIWQIIRWVRRAPKPMKEEEILVDFMTNAMNCSYLNEEIADV